MSMVEDTRINVPVPFPTLVMGSGPIAITKKNGIWTVAFSITGINQVVPPPANWPTDYILVWDSLTQSWISVPLSALAGAVGPPQPTILGGVYSNAGQAHKWVYSINTDGSVTLTQPAFADISGVAAPAQLPLFTSTLAGAVPASGGGTVNFMRADGTWAAPAGGGSPSNTNPLMDGVADPGVSALYSRGDHVHPSDTSKQASDADLTAIAALSGTGIARRTATTPTWAVGGAVVNAELATMPAYTFKGNNTGGVATPTDVDIAALTAKAAPAGGDFLLLSDQAAAGAWKKVAIANLPGASGGISEAPNDGQQYGRQSLGWTVIAGGGYTLPPPTATTLGGVFSNAGAANKWISTINTDGSVTLSQPSFADLSGSIAGAQLPAFTGDVTKAAGSAVTVLANIPNDTPMAGDLLATNIVAPATPAAGKTRLYADSTNKILSAKNDAGTVSITVVPSVAGANQFATGLSATGVISYAQPTISGIAGLGAGVAAALAIAVGSVGSFVVNGGALGSPSSVGTMPAFTLGGTVSGGGNQINNVIIGASNPLAGSFTTLSASTSVTSPLHIGGSGTTGTQLTFQTTTGNGTTDGFKWTRGNNGAITAMTLDSVGLSIGANAPANAFVDINKNTVTGPFANSTSLLRLVNADAVSSILEFAAFGTGRASAIYGGWANGTAGAPTGSDTSGGMMDFRGYGWNGSAWALGGAVQIVPNETWSSGHQGTNTRIIATPVGTAGIVVTANFQAGVSIGDAIDPGVGALTTTTSIKSKGATQGIGYATGAGGTVTQITSKSTAVTLNTVTGTITTHNASLAAATIVSFTINNSAIAATDHITCAHESGGTTGLGAYTINIRATGAGTAECNIRNNSAGALTDAIVIRFFVHKSVNA